MKIFRNLNDDVHHLMRSFEQNKRLGLMIRNELANPVTSRHLWRRCLKKWGQALRGAQGLLGHLQKCGSPTPFVRIAVTRLAAAAIEHLIAAVQGSAPSSAFIDMKDGEIHLHALAELPERG